MLKTAINRFRTISALEGLSFLILVLIAMPIKYIGENPDPVRIFGMAHGVLFIIFFISLLEIKYKENLDKGYMFQLFVLSLIPFGAFFIEKSVKKLA